MQLTVMDEVLQSNRPTFARSQLVCGYCGKTGHLSKVCFSKKAKAPEDGSKDAAVSDNVDNCSLFIRNKNDMLYSGVLIGKEAKNIKNGSKKLPAQDCNSKEAKEAEGQGSPSSQKKLRRAKWGVNTKLGPDMLR